MKFEKEMEISEFELLNKRMLFKFMHGFIVRLIYQQQARERKFYFGSCFQRCCSWSVNSIALGLR